jgi:hypothetical protein
MGSIENWKDDAELRHGLRTFVVHEQVAPQP